MDAIGEFLFRLTLEPVFRFLFERVSFFLGRGLYELFGITPSLWAIPSHWSALDFCF